MATVYKRKSTYWVRFQRRGKEVRRSAHTTSKATAQQFLAGLLDEVQRLDRGGNPRRTYKEALERFTYDYLPTLKLGTQTRYRTSFRQLTSTCQKSPSLIAVESWLSPAVSSLPPAVPGTTCFQMRSRRG